MFFGLVLLVTLLAIHVDNCRQLPSNPGQYDKHPKTKHWNPILPSSLKSIRHEHTKGLKAEVQPDSLDKNPIQSSESRNMEHVPSPSHRSINHEIRRIRHASEYRRKSLKTLLRKRYKSHGRIKMVKEEKTSAPPETMISSPKGKNNQVYENT